ncbi:hypothetical protein V494_03581 [Pseudogymnoascus sp. VKM F-4513 (FW-928)]|nr:hypothetical protein V494_03581 [Pseudogymnoascus sp. VKM F-4513 (FW-928)]
MHCQNLRTLVSSLLLALLATSSHISTAAAADAAADTNPQQCYGINGDLRPATIQPCNKDRAAGTHVACCDLGKTRPDICTAAHPFTTSTPAKTRDGAAAPITSNAAPSGASA